ncbi:dual specificity testis-specific protein kinase 2-like isoform X2 [Tigriopus californicus]|uniref:dual specificity testis-specific protein kinase 2-like isoform X2 n=1 Tax=Tigriopus californicus TaxID=6832 RepID=UPI0027DA25F6|nr:dual specificity testis-specific protein kinase 2-like isoform X2 [Tigriopus californicus]
MSMNYVTHENSSDIKDIKMQEVIWRPQEPLVRSKKSSSFCVSSLRSKVPLSDVIPSHHPEHRVMGQKQPMHWIRRTQSFMRPESARKRQQRRNNARNEVRRAESFNRRTSFDLLVSRLGVVEEGRVLNCKHPVNDEEPMKVFNNYKQRRLDGRSDKAYPREVSSCQALKSAVSSLYNLEDFHRDKIGEGFFCEVFRVTHKGSGQVLVLKKNKNRSNRWSMLKEVQLMNKLHHKNILKYEAACVHEGQLHAITEYLDGGSLDKWIQDCQKEFPWDIRMSLALDIACGMAYLHKQGYFHRDLTSKNILIRLPCDETMDKPVGVVADFGLAAKIPQSDLESIGQVGSPYWMSPECIKGKYYDDQSDVFSFGIILCEMIARIDADPDILPRTENFGVDYIAFCDKIATDCPPEFLKLAFQCVQIEPRSRPSFNQIRSTLCEVMKSPTDSPKEQRKSSIAMQALQSPVTALSPEERHSAPTKVPPREKARIHPRRHLSHDTYVAIGKEMSLRDPHYIPIHGAGLLNPFAMLPLRLDSREKIVEPKDLFCSCFELCNSSDQRVGLSKRPSTIRKSVSMIHQDYDDTDFCEEIAAKLQLNAKGMTQSNARS